MCFQAQFIVDTSGIFDENIWIIVATIFTLHRQKMLENVIHIYEKYKKWNQSLAPACLESVQEGK